MDFRGGESFKGEIPRMMLRYFNVAAEDITACVIMGQSNQAALIATRSSADYQVGGTFTFAQESPTN